jgi:uncharacterized protein
VIEGNEGVVDVDVHHTWARADELLAYLPERWREYFSSVAPQPASVYYSRAGGSAMRLDSVPAGGGPPGSDYRTLCDQHLDAHPIERALLTFGFGVQAAFFRAEGAVELCRAANEWNFEHWLGGEDDRLYGLLMVPTGAPAEAAREIRRAGSHPRIVGVLIVSNPLNTPFGHIVYDPIYEAASELDLPVVTHVGSEFSSKGTLTAGGLPTTKLEYYTLLEQPGMHHFTSMLVGGVFERFPKLRVLFNEHGFTWVPWVLWGLDARYDRLRRENAELRRRPSEYFHEHIWIGSQPFESGAGRTKLIELLETCPGIEERLCFASDYPHWDADPPNQISVRLPVQWRSKVMRENAASLFGWDLTGVAVASGSAAIAGEPSEREPDSATQGANL